MQQTNSECPGRKQFERHQYSEQVQRMLTREQKVLFAKILQSRSASEVLAEEV